MRVGGTDPEAVSGAAPRSASRLVAATFKLYRRYPLLFLALAAGVVVPYYLIALAVTGEVTLVDAEQGAGVGLLLASLLWFVITPLVSALHIHAVSEVREGRVPQLASVARAGLRASPAVVAVSIMSWLGIALGFLALIVPGVYLMLRWAVVAQAAAIEREGWLPAMRSSGRLADRCYGHIFVFLLLVGVIVAVPSYLIELAAAEIASDVLLVMVWLALQIVALSVTALAAALLYFDLQVRHETATASSPSAPPPLDSDEHSAGGRPKGWYVDPDNPSRMRYWAGESHGWVANTKTPRKVRKELKDQGGPEQ